MGVTTNLARYTCDRCGKTQITDEKSDIEIIGWGWRHYINSDQHDEYHIFCDTCLKKYKEYMSQADNIWKDYHTRGGSNPTPAAANGKHYATYDKDGKPIPQYDAQGKLLPLYDKDDKLVPQYDKDGKLIIFYDADGKPLK